MLLEALLRALILGRKIWDFPLSISNHYIYIKNMLKKKNKTVITFLPLGKGSFHMNARNRNRKLPKIQSKFHF